jgi:photosystem II PsbK protein
MHWSLHGILLRYYMKVEFIPLTFESANTRRYFVFGKVRRKKILNLPSPFSLRKITQSKSNYLLYKNEMLVMPNILSLTCIFFNSVLYPTSFFFAKLPEAYAIFNPIVDVMPVIPLFFSISLCLASCFKFPMKCLVLYLPNWMLYSFQKINKMCTRRELLYFYITSMYARQTIKDSVW